MGASIVVADANKEHAWELCNMLIAQHYRPTPVYSFQELKSYLQKNSCLVVVLNINTLSVDNRAIGDLAIKTPGVYFLGLTDQRFNPELREAICYHIFACLTIPVDPGELYYWLRSIEKNDSKP